MSEHQEPGNPKQGGFITSLMGIAVGLIAEVYSASRQKSSNQNNKEANDAALVRATKKTATATKVIGWFAGLTFGAAIIQAIIFNRQLAIMQRQMNDAEIQEAASITIQNLAVAGFPDEIVLSYDVLNTGRTRADQVTTEPGYMWVNSDGKLTLEQQKFTILHQISQNQIGFGGRSNPSEMGITIDPKDAPQHVSRRFGALPQIPYGVPAEELSKWKLPTRQDIITGHTISFFYVTGIYRDIFGHILHVVNCTAFTGGPSWESCEGQQNRHY